MITAKRKSPEAPIIENTNAKKSPKLEDTPQDLSQMETENLSSDGEMETEELSRETKMERVFLNLRLRRIIKENHLSSIKQLAFYSHKHIKAPTGIDYKKSYSISGYVQRAANDTSNVLATVGGSELSIYDNENCGDHLDITSNFDITPEDVQDKVELRTKYQLETFCWIYRKGDAVLATGGAKGKIHILSVADSAEIRTIKAHDNLICDLQAHPQNDDWILSVSKDKTVRLWDITNGQCLAIYKTDATVACFHPSGDQFITGNYRGELRLWDTVKTSDADKTKTVQESSSRLLKKMNGTCYIDCIQFVNDKEVLSKSTNGRLEYWNFETEKLVRAFRIQSGENFSRFGVSSDQQFVCVGSSVGSIFIYNLHTGDLVMELHHKKATKPVRCCTFSRDCSQVLAGTDDGFLMRYDYVDDETLEKWANWRKKE